MVINADADLGNADWTRRSWDLDTHLPEAERPAMWEGLPIEELRRIVQLPVWEAAPDYAREIVQRRLAE